MKTSKLFRFLKCVFAFCILHFTFYIQPAFAQVASEVQGLALGSDDPRVIAAKIIRIALSFLGVVALAIVLYGGVLWMTAVGNEERIEKAKKVLISAVIGLVIILSSLAITQFVLSRLLQATQGPGEVSIGAYIGQGGGLPADAFIIKGIAPSGSVTIRNVVARLTMNRAPDRATVDGNVSVIRKDNDQVVSGAFSVNGNIIEFRPSASCPAPNQARKCFDKDTDFRVEARPGLRSVSGRNLNCGGLAPSCSAEFHTGSSVDVAPPTVVIESPDPGAGVPVDSCVPVQARARDGGGISAVEFYADGQLIEDGVVVPPPSGGAPPLGGVLVELPCWPTEPPAPKTHKIKAKAYDIDDNSATSSEISVVVRPLHCFNNVKDDQESKVDCDSSVSGPSGCGLCDGSTCTQNEQCRGGVCVNVCASPTIITGVSPGDGRPGTFVTIAGTGFGTAPGKVFFKDNKIASAPAACSGAIMWKENYALVGVPEGAISGPVTIETANCATNNPLCRDSSNDGRGPVIPPPRGGAPPLGGGGGSFEVNDSSHPGLCSISSPPNNLAQGQRGTIAQARGVQFGASQGQGGIFFGETRGAGISNWTDTGATTAVPSISYGSVQAQVMNQEGVLSNTLPYNVLSDNPDTLPELVGLSPASGGIGAGITLSGRNFGSQAGSVYFISSNGTAVLADISLPSQCAGLWWTQNAITVKVPTGLSVGQHYQVYVHRYDGQQSGQRDFTVTNTPAGPFLACIRPLAGPPFTNVAVYGENFGSSVAEPNGLYFTRQGSEMTRANLTSASSGVGDPCPSNGWSNTKVCAQVSALARTGPVVIDQVIQGATRRSNPLSFAVGSCREPQNSPLYLRCPPNTACCADGTCNTICPASVIPSSSFGWQFTTAPAPIIPEVLERCDKIAEDGHPLYPPSPAPFATREGPSGSGAGRSGSTQVCKNAAVSVGFNRPVIAENLDADTIKIDRCTGSGNFLTGGNSDFSNETTIWGPVLGTTNPAYLRAERVQGGGRDDSDPGKYALRLTKLEDDTGPGWIDESGLQRNYEYWFGYQANLNLDTNGKTYTASALLRAEKDSTAVGKRAGILIQRAGGAGEEGTPGFWQKASEEITLSENWQMVSAIISFDSGINSNATGFVRLFVEGLPYDIRVPEPEPDPMQIFSVIIDDVQVIGDPCVTVSAVPLSQGSFDPYPGQTGFRFWPDNGWTTNSWYRVALLGGAGGITAAGEQGQPMPILQNALNRCGYATAAYCFRFKTAANDEQCRVGAIAVLPNSRTAQSENEKINYSAVPVAANDRCLALNPNGYNWTWDSTEPSKATVSFTSGDHIGQFCAGNADCPIGRSACSNDAGKICRVNSDCGEGNTCQELSACPNGFCRFMPWTTTATALKDTEGDAIKIQAHIEAQNANGQGDLYIDFIKPRVINFWPSCSEACQNAAIGAQFNTAMLDEPATDGQSIINPANVRLWAVSCGNGIKDKGEDCDDGNTQNQDGCSEICLHEGSNYTLRCGDGDIDDFEDCDDGNLRLGDRCSDHCVNEGVGTETCGNGVTLFNSTTGVGEECDDGNKQNGDGCSDKCLNEGTRSDIPICGNRRLDRGEECEAGPDGAFAQWCDSATCLRQGPENAQECGNGQIDPGEECDAQTPILNTPAKKSLCDSSCQWTGTRRPNAAGAQGCGNAQIEIGEDCDDGNLRPGDGCDGFCRNEGSRPGDIPACGNGTRDWAINAGGEDCDDGNITNGDGCSEHCLNEGRPGASCGNRVVEVGEDCDTATAEAGTCSANCLFTTRTNTGRAPILVSDIALRYDDVLNALTITPSSVLNPNTLYRVLLRGIQKLSGLNFAYDWNRGDAPPAKNKCADNPDACNTFSWTFKTKEAICAVERVELNPAKASLYVIGAKQKYSAQPFGTPDSCDSAGQRLNPLGYNWLWDTDKPEIVADIDGAATIGGTTYKGVDIIPSTGDFRIDPYQQAIAKGIEKFCRPTDGPFSPTAPICIASNQCVAGQICAPRNPWGVTLVRADAQGKSNSAELTVYCVAATDKDCPVPGGSVGSATIGRGLDNCCYSRPRIANRTPQGSGACRNALIKVDFDQQISEQDLAQNFIISQKQNSPCPSSGGVVAPVGSSGMRRSYYWCPVPNLRLTATLTDDPDGNSAVILKPSAMLGSANENITYRIEIKGDADIADATVSGVRSISGVGFYHAPSGTDTTWEFTTGTQICVLDVVEITGGVTFSHIGETARVNAMAYNKKRDGTLQAIQPQTGYTWHWSWGSSDNQIATVANNKTSETVNDNQVVTAGTKNGVAVINATATIDNSNPVKSVVGTKEFTVQLCDNPWPYDSQTQNRLIDSEEHPLGGDKPTNFSTWYCRDGSPLLPELNYTDAPALLGEFSDTAQSPQKIKEILLTALTFHNGEDIPNGVLSGSAAERISEINGSWTYDFDFSETGDYELVVETSNYDHNNNRDDDDLSNIPQILEEKDIPQEVRGELSEDGKTTGAYYHNIEVLLDSQTKGVIRNKAVGPNASHSQGSVIFQGVSKGEHHITLDWNNDNWLPRSQIGSYAPGSIWNANLKIHKLVLKKGLAKDDAIGIRVMSNPDRLGLNEWYKQMGFGGNPTPLASQIDGYAAIQDGNTVYVAAMNAVPNTAAPAQKLVYGNVYVISVSEGAPSSFQTIFDQILKNFVFNVNIIETKKCAGDSQRSCDNDLDCALDGSVLCDAKKDKLRRDLTRLNDLETIQSALSKYKDDHSRHYPALEAGTFIRSLSTSRWPSWQSALGAALGASPPLDPINRFGQGCSSQASEVGVYDQLTCWNEIQQTYRCPFGSHIYQYQSHGGLGYTLSAEFELIERPNESPMGWDLFGWSPETSGEIIVSTGGVCSWRAPGDIQWSNSQPICGNRVLEAGEDCEIGTTQEQVVGLGNMTSCVAERSCNSLCAWNSWSGGKVPNESDCRPGRTFCGNGIIESDQGEFCDDGLLNGQYGKCKTNCSGLHNWCGDGRVNGPEICDDGVNNGSSYNLSNGGANMSRGWCRFDCTGFGPRCGDREVNGPEQCEGEQTRTSDKYCVGGNNDGNPCTNNEQCDSRKCFYCPASDTQQVSASGYPLILRQSCRSCYWLETWACVLQGGCGNGRREGTEQCDDGANNSNTGACTLECKNARCGDGFVQGNEMCDLGDTQNGQPCVAPYGGTCLSCNSQCRSTTYSGGFCGDNIRQPAYEQCDRSQGLDAYNSFTPSYVCQGILGQDEFFWGFASEIGTGLGRWEADYQSSISQVSGGYHSDHAMKIITAGSDSNELGARAYFTQTNGKKYIAEALINSVGTTGGARVKLSMDRGGVTAVQGDTIFEGDEIVVDNNEGEWQRLRVVAEYDQGPNRYRPGFLRVRVSPSSEILVDNIHIFPFPTTTCSGSNCQKVCERGGIPCENIVRWCEGGDRAWSRCQNDTDCPGPGGSCEDNNIDNATEITIKISDSCDNDKDGDGYPITTDCNDLDSSKNPDRAGTCAPAGDDDFGP